MGLLTSGVHMDTELFFLIKEWMIVERNNPIVSKHPKTKKGRDAFPVCKIRVAKRGPILAPMNKMKV